MRDAPSGPKLWTAPAAAMRTSRFGSGMIGSGGVVRVAPVVSGPRVSPLICTLSRPFGAGFGIGTVCCAIEGAAAIRLVAATSAQAKAARDDAMKAVIRDF